MSHSSAKLGSAVSHSAVGSQSRSVVGTQSHSAVGTQFHCFVYIRPRNSDRTSAELRSCRNHRILGWVNVLLFAETTSRKVVLRRVYQCCLGY